MTENMVAFGPEELGACPQVEAGQVIDCRRCGGKHVLEETKTEDGRPGCLLVYHCDGDLYLGAVAGADITGLLRSGS